MHEKSREIIQLIAKYLNDELDETGFGHLEKWRLESPENNALFERLTSERELFSSVQNSYDQEQKIFDKIKAKGVDLDAAAVGEGKIRTMSWRWLVAASVVTLVAFISYMALVKKKSAQEPVAVTQPATDVAPGSFKAKLTLDDGSSIYLDKSATGEITKQGNAVVTNQDGQLVYSSQGHSTNMLHNILSTARGETYPAILSDGSKVWLNNETSIRYAVNFTENSRVVELKSGEAYFEVVHNADKPFKVLVNGTEVEVLGTRFSISAYPNEETTKTSLLTGKVQISHDNANAQVLTAGNQASVDKTGKINVVKDADVDGSIAWIRGYFHFEEADIPTVLRQLARWYDVDVVYSGQIPTSKMRGELERNIPLSEVLKNLEQIAKVHLKIEGKKIIVSQ